MMDLTTVLTPALILDRGKLEKNCQAMLARCKQHGVRLRPHMKTLKSIDAARIAMDPVHPAVAVATLNEAEYFASHDIADIQYAVCIAPDKLDRAAGVLRRAGSFSFFVDSPAVAQRVVTYARKNAVRFHVWIEVDSGEHRTGLAPCDPDLIATARVLSTPDVTLRGLATHGGQSYKCRDTECASQVAEAERAALLAAAKSLRSHGTDVHALSAGSTPTAVHGRSFDGLTELRPGVYMAGDSFQESLGTVAMDRIAVTVLATVISHNVARNHIVIDAGGLALSKDRSTASCSKNRGYGLVLDIHGHPSFGELLIHDVHQEHGELLISDPDLFEQLPIGSKLRIVPNHVCMTAAMYSNYLVVEGGTKILATWPRTNGWT
jgi:D-serine deaminase-like pyridoxal phosphate-dependent protein